VENHKSTQGRQVMANIMTTFVRVDNINQDVVSFFKSVVDTDPEQKYYPHTPNDLLIINTLYGTDFTEENYYDIGWGNEHLGSKWLRFDWIEIDNDSIRFNLESAWHFPEGFIKKLTERVTSIHSETIVTGTYEDESYDPMGAFLYADDYEDIEDYDGEVDYDAIWDDDDYRENLLDELGKYQKGLEEAYYEYLEDKQ
jgi:hypothetical protein